MNIGEKILKEAPDLGTGDEAWEENRRTFWKMHSDLLAQGYEGKWVAILEGKVIDSDTDRKALIRRVWAKYGQVPAYFQLVLKEGLRKFVIRQRKAKLMDNKRFVYETPPVLPIPFAGRQFRPPPTFVFCRQGMEALPYIGNQSISQ